MKMAIIAIKILRKIDIFSLSLSFYLFYIFNKWEIRVRIATIIIVVAMNVVNVHRKIVSKSNTKEIKEITLI